MGRQWRALLQWSNAPSSNRDGLIVAFIGSVLFGAGGALLLGAFEGIDLGFELPVWITAILALLGLGLGSLLTLCATKKVRRRSSLRGPPALDAGQAMGAFVESFRLLLDHPPLDIERILPAAAEIVENRTGTKVHISLWEPDEIAQDAVWKPVHCPTHSAVEADHFAVPIAGSWIGHKQTVHTNAVAFPLPDIGGLVEPGQPTEPDLEAFLRHGCNAVLCCRLPNEMDGGKPLRRIGPCLVMLGEAPHAFSELDARYLQLLALVFGLRLREARLAEQLADGDAVQD